MNVASRLARSALAEWRFLLGRGRSTLVVLLGIPFLYPVAISWLYAADQPVERPVLVVDDDNSALSRRVMLDLEATRDLRIAGRPGSPDEGFREVLAGRAEALLWIPADFSATVKRGRQAHLKLWINSGNMLTYAVAYPAVSAVVQHLDEDLGAAHLRSRGVPGDRADQRVMPIRRDERFLYHADLSYGGFLIPAVMLVVLQQLVLVGLTFSTGFGRETGTLSDPRRPWASAWGKALAHLPVYWLGSCFLALGLFPFFGWPSGWPLSLLALMAAFVVAMLPVAVMVAGAVRDRYSAFLLLMLLSTPVFMAAGWAWPTDQLPGYLQVLSAALPLTPALSALRIVSLKTGDLRVIAPQLLHLAVLFVAWTAATLALQAAAARRARPAAAVP